MSSDPEIRHSEAESPVVIDDEVNRARREAANGLVQAAMVEKFVMDVLDGRPFRLRTSTILSLNRCAIDGLDAYAGNFRPGAVKINKSSHVPPDGHLVAALVEELCDYVNDNWAKATAIHLASMLMWRMNWIHPFTDGNGRTSRAVSYLVLCAHSKHLLRGNESIPEQIVNTSRTPYYEALEAADNKYRDDKNLNFETVLEMEELMRAMLAKQLKSAFDRASGLQKP